MSSSLPDRARCLLYPAEIDRHRGQLDPGAAVFRLQTNRLIKQFRGGFRLVCAAGEHRFEIQEFGQRWPKQRSAVVWKALHEV